jgi:hypothetical protein
MHLGLANMVGFFFPPASPLAKCCAQRTLIEPAVVPVVAAVLELIVGQAPTRFNYQAGYGRLEGKKYNSKALRLRRKNGPGRSPSGDLLHAVLVRMHWLMIQGPPDGSGIEESNWKPPLDHWLLFQQAQNGSDDTPKPKMQGFEYNWNAGDKHNHHQDFGKEPERNQKITFCFSPKVPGYENDGRWESRRIKEGPLTGRQQPPTPGRIAVLAWLPC